MGTSSNALWHNAGYFVLCERCYFDCILFGLLEISRHGILGHLGVECTSGGTTIPLNLIETEQELKGSLK